MYEYTLFFYQLYAVMLLQQRGVATQSTIVATAPCTLVSTSRQPNSSISQQGLFLTLRFSDFNGRPYTVTFPGCLQGDYQVGNQFPIRYVPGDPNIISSDSPVSDQSNVSGTIIALGAICGAIGLLMVIAGTIPFLWELLQRRALYRSLHRER